MNHACESVIRIDQQIKFVCIVDENAKLLVGQGRSISTNIDTLKTSETTDSSIHTNKSKIEELVEIHFKYRNIYLFYSDYLLWVIKSCTGHLDDTKNKDYFSITQSSVRAPLKMQTKDSRSCFERYTLSPHCILKC
jgi:hypothetical protein